MKPNWRELHIIWIVSRCFTFDFSRAYFEQNIAFQVILVNLQLLRQRMFISKYFEMKSFLVRHECVHFPNFSKIFYTQY